MNHVSISLGSAGELDTDIVLAERLHFLSPDTAVRLAAANDEVSRMLYGLFNALGSKIRAGEDR
jgi:four helix bundle protein